MSLVVASWGPAGPVGPCPYLSPPQLGGGAQASQGTVLPGLDQSVVLTEGEAINH